MRNTKISLFHYCDSRGHLISSESDDTDRKGPQLIDPMSLCSCGRSLSCHPGVYLKLSSSGSIVILSELVCLTVTLEDTSSLLEVFYARYYLENCT